MGKVIIRPYGEGDGYQICTHYLGSVQYWNWSDKESYPKNFVCMVR